MSDIVERLAEPEAHYPGNFDTPKRANAMLSCLCQEAKDEIETLRQQLAEKDEEISRLNVEQLGAEVVLKELREQLADVETDVDTLAQHNIELQQQLAASQAREQQLREALIRAYGCYPPQFSKDRKATVVRMALDIPTDTTALQALIVKAGEVMRERCCNVLFSYPKATEIAIRALPGVTLEDLQK